MYTVLVAVRVRPDKVAAFLAAIAVNAAASRRDEPGCLVFEVHRAAADPLDYLLYEVYTDEQAFTVAHRAAPHYADWQAAAADCLEPGGRTNTYFRPLIMDLGRAAVPAAGDGQETR